MYTKGIIACIVLMASVLEVTSRVISKRSENLESVIFLAPRSKLVPEPFRKLSLPKEIMKELRRRIDTSVLSSQNVNREELTEAYVATKPVGKTKHIEKDIALVPLSQKEIFVLTDYSDKTSKLRRVLEDTPIEEEILTSTLSVKEEISTVTLPHEEVPTTMTAVIESTTTKSGGKIFMTTSGKKAPSTFRKLKLSEKIMDDLRLSMPPKKLVTIGVPAKQLTSIYLGKATEFDPPGFVSIFVNDTVFNLLEKFVVN